MFNDIVQQEQCESASVTAQSVCANKTGALCIYEANSTRPYTCRMDAGIGDGVNEGTANCKLIYITLLYIIFILIA